MTPSALLRQMDADSSAYTALKSTNLDDMAFNANCLGCERLWLTAEKWDEFAPHVRQLTPPGNVSCRSFQYWGIWFDRGASCRS